MKTDNIRAVYYFRKLLLSVLLSPVGRGQAARGGCPFRWLLLAHFAHRGLGPAWGFARLLALSKETLSESWLSQRDYFICGQTSSTFHLCCLLGTGNDRMMKEVTRGHKDTEPTTSGLKLKLLMWSWDWCKHQFWSFRRPVVATAPQVEQGRRRVFLGTKYARVICVVTVLPIWGNILPASPSVLVLGCHLWSLPFIPVPYFLFYHFSQWLQYIMYSLVSHNRHFFLPL